MRFMSPYIDKEINLPDEKVPDAERFSLKCPFTGKKILVEKDGDDVKVQAAEPVENTKAPEQSREQLPQVEPDIFPPGAKVAFLYAKSGPWTKAAEAYADKNGYHVSSAEDALTAVAKLRLNSYHLLFVEEGGDSERLAAEINSWPGLKRREANFILLGDDSPSMQPNIAFEKGVNYYFNRNDEGKAEQLFKEADDGYGLYYRPLREAEKRVHGLTE